MKKRAKSAQETRQRIVEATYALHSEQPIAETTMRQIAERAGVGIGTVYNHFPAYDDVVAACGDHTFAMSQPPSADIFAGLTERRARVDRLAHEVFAFYGRCPGLAAARADRAKIGALDKALSRWETELHALAVLAAGEGTPPVQLAMVTALLDYDVYVRLMRDLPPGADAAHQVSILINLWLDQAPAETITA